MKTCSIPLPRAVPGIEYIIHHIESSNLHANVLKGYGITPGTKIKLLFKSPSHDPYAYEIMGAVLAIRHEDSKKIYIIPAL